MAAVTHSSRDAATIISPFVTSYNPDAFINVDSTLIETVAIGGIVNTFTITLDETDSKTFLNGFDVSGLSVDARLSQKDINMANLIVSLTDDDTFRVPFKALLEKVINDATDDTGKILDLYLATQLKDAFLSSFGGLLQGGVELHGNGTSPTTPPNAVPAVVGDANAGTSEEEQYDNTVATVSITLQTNINNFKVDVMTDASSAAANLINGHTTAALNSMLRQCGKDRIVAYLVNDASGSNEMLTTDALPLYQGDSVEFVFDVDVTAAGANAGADDSEDVPTAGDQAPAMFSLNLANRRVAFKISLYGDSETTSIFNGLREQSHEAPVAGNPAGGPGTNPVGTEE
jgi:hypothetical protein